MAYIHGKRRQRRMFPSCFEDYIEAEDTVRVYDVFIDQPEFEELGIH